MALLVAALLTGCGQPRSHTVRTGPPSAAAPVAGLLATGDAVRLTLERDTAVRERDAARAEADALRQRLATTAVVRRTASRGNARSTATRSPSGACGGWEGLIGAYAWDVGRACRVMMCESRGNPAARNASGHNGLFQVASGPTDPAANVRQAFSMYQSRGWQPWAASRSCWG